MPGNDRTSPNGSGSITGRRMDYCVGNNQPGFINQNFGRSFCRGKGIGPGYRSSNGFLNQVNLPVRFDKTVLENEI
ncbi:MAG: DUF5320 domain-containing protein [Candidatus Marinimicrobia bacterium]|nr:DUF5320 domain-containing protein [Candidatus Neomarinimicrobiota bacterium]